MGNSILDKRLAFKKISLNSGTGHFFFYSTDNYATTYCYGDSTINFCRDFCLFRSENKFSHCL